jgi:hypothetical protein
LAQKTLEIFKFLTRAFELAKPATQFPQDPFGALRDGALQRVAIWHLDAARILQVAALVRLRPAQRIGAIISPAALAWPRLARTVAFPFARLLPHLLLKLLREHLCGAPQAIERALLPLGRLAWPPLPELPLGIAHALIGLTKPFALLHASLAQPLSQLAQAVAQGLLQILKPLVPFAGLPLLALLALARLLALLPLLALAWLLLALLAALLPFAERAVPEVTLFTLKAIKLLELPAQLLRARIRLLAARVAELFH